MIELAGYPLHMVHVEKMVTAIQRGVANTRWRDYGDIWTLPRRHSVSADDLNRAIEAVANRRGVTLAPLADVFDGAALARGSGRSYPPGGGSRRPGLPHRPPNLPTRGGTVTIERPDGRPLPADEIP